MAVDPYIARGVTPIGEGLQQTLAQLYAMRQGDARLKLAQGAADIDKQNAETFRTRTEQERQSAIAKAQEQQRAQVLARLGNAIGVARRNPQALPYVQRFAQEAGLDVGEQISPEQLDAIAAQAGLQVEAPFEQTDDYKKIAAQTQSQINIEKLRARNATDLERLRQQGKDREPKPANAQLVTRPGDDGKLQDFAFDPQTRQLAPVGSPYVKQAPLSPKDTTTAKVKLTQIDLVRKQLANAREKFDAIKNTVQAGPGARLIPSPKGKALDAAIDAMRGSVTALTRVPGVGAMSDYETRLDQSKFPERGDYEDVIEQKLGQLESVIDTLDGGYRDLLGGPSDTNTQPASADGIPTVQSPDEARKLAPGTRFRTPDGRVKVR